jgi:hypothetical protein
MNLKQNMCYAINKYHIRLFCMNVSVQFPRTDDIRWWSITHWPVQFPRTDDTHWWSITHWPKHSCLILSSDENAPFCYIVLLVARMTCG